MINYLKILFFLLIISCNTSQQKIVIDETDSRIKDFTKNFSNDYKINAIYNTEEEDWKYNLKIYHKNELIYKEDSLIEFEFNEYVFETFIEDNEHKYILIEINDRPFENYFKIFRVNDNKIDSVFKIPYYYNGKKNNVTELLFTDKLVKTKNENDLINISWTKLTEINNEFIIFNPCDAQNLKVKIDTSKKINTLTLIQGQDDYKYEIIKTHTDNDTLLIDCRVYENIYVKQTFKIIPFDSSDRVYKLTTKFPNNLLSELVIYEKDENLYSIVNQPCKECWDECD